MTELAFIGLGIMGSPMAVNLARAGYSVTGHNRSPGRAAALIAAGGSEATSVARAVSTADVIAIMVPDSPDVERVMTHDGVLDHARPDTLIIDFSTIQPDVSIALAKQAAAQGLSMIDAPVSGGEPGAINGTLSIMVGGEPDDFQRALPILEAVGKTIVHVGSNSAGQTVKAANQLMVAANIQGLAEAIMFLRSRSVDLDRALDVLAGGLAGSQVLDQKRAKMTDHDFAPGFRILLHNKDLAILTAAAQQAGLAMPMTALLAQLMAAAVANGDGHLDHSALLRTVERLNGLT
ncbi:2-hydroxy-3-oxopropionate reductase [Mycolicibacterium sp. HK-90]|uniref:2-hydroxy-3-oxopropionate reductase n=1 Tax=Mycolicibacterium sp. HK-90 TaxID=3056937 RepID=UPI002659773B|nr:2-hydroxy-3-oxopropionate reductase [Mycolicibacterium sp. HK-90]WKG03955.1 2-hydroxy-3-oxopropionate reductase [Mycolicibacterium sp. HK-90]